MKYLIIVDVDEFENNKNADTEMKRVHRYMEDVDLFSMRGKKKKKEYIS